MTKDELLRLIAEDPDVRAALQAITAEPSPLAVAPALTAAVETVFNGPGWLAPKATHPSAGPQTRSRVGPPPGDARG